MVKALLCLSLLLFACSDDRASGGKLVVGMSMDFAPFDYLDNGKPAGFDVEMMMEIGAILKKKVEFVDMDFGGVIAAVNSGRVDVGASGITVTEERKKNVDFVSCYYTPKPVAFYPSGVIFDKKNGLSGKKVGVQTGTTMEAYLRTLHKLDPTIQVRSLSKNTYLLQELRAKKIDALLLETGQAVAITGLEKGSFDYTIMDKDGAGDECYSLAIKQGSSLKASIDKAIAELKKNGTLTRLEKKWLV